MYHVASPKKIGSTWAGAVSWFRFTQSLTQEHMVRLGADPRVVYLVEGERGNKGKEANNGFIIKAIPSLGNWNFTSQGDRLEHTPELSQLRDEEAVFQLYLYMVC